MNSRCLTIFLASLVFAGSTLAGEGGALAKKNSCLMCHTSGPGPTFAKVAEKYRGEKDAQALLEKKVRSGGTGVWGKAPMAPTSKKVSDEEIKSMVQWVLSLK